MTISTSLFVLLLFVGYVLGQEEEQTCVWNDLSCYQDPHLKEIEIDLGKGTNETFLAYFPPDVSTFYQQEPFSRKPVRPRFTGQFGKFINLGPTPIRIFWYVPVAGPCLSYKNARSNC